MTRRPDKVRGSAAPTDPRFDLVRYIVNGGRTRTRWIWVEGCTWCGSLVLDQDQHVRYCTGKAP